MSLANELRIGNWVNMVYPSGKKEVIVKNLSKNFVNGLGISGIEGISITEEWLLKFGFELYDYLPNDEMSDNPDFIYLSYKMELEGKRYYYSITNTEFHDWEFCKKVEWAEEMLIASCQYVHQLQNLYFALTGTELQFNK